MSRGINRVTLVGHLGKDPEIRAMPSGKSVANFSMATSEKWKDRSGETKEDTQWHRIVAFAQLADIIGEYAKKGQQAYVEGKIRYRKWEDRDGNERYSTEIIADRFLMLGGQRQGGGQRVDRAQERPQERANAPAEQEMFDDDIPF